MLQKGGIIHVRPLGDGHKSGDNNRESPMTIAFLLRTFVITLLLFSFACVASEAEPTGTKPKSVADDFPGSIKLLPGYTHHMGLGYVSMYSVVRMGEIRNQKGFIISYDIYTVSRNTVRPLVLDPPSGTNKVAISEPDWRYSIQKLCQWSREQVVNGQRVQIWLSKKKSLHFHFPDGGADFTTSPVTSEEDVTDAMLIVLTYSPLRDARPLW